MKHEINTGKKLDNTDVRLKDFLSHISPDVADTFTEEQILAIKKILQNREWSNHTIDLRVSVLIPRISFYFLILAGEERRSKQRLQYEKSLYPFWNFTNICFLSMFSLIFITCSIYTLFFLKSLIPNNINLAFPTHIPGIENQEYCEKFNRKWKENKCWDDQHSSHF